MVQNDLPGEGPSFRQVVKLEQGEYPSASLSFASLACFHCNDAPCLKVCPMKAISRNAERGIVEVDEDLCIGCKACAMVCPFGAPQFGREGKMKKCHACMERAEKGMEPACVHTCTTRALGFGPLEELSRKKAEKASGRLREGFWP